jgi:hypothetical protein
MNLTPHDITRLRQLMDACRANSDDLSLPGMADLAVALREHSALRCEWESRQRSDRVIAGAMHDVSAPAGLAERILAAAATRDGERLAQAARAAMTTEAEPNANTIPPPATEPARWSRRRWLRYAGSTAALLLVAIAAWQFWPRQPQVVSTAQLAGEAQEWFNVAAAVKAGWQPPSTTPPLGFPAGSITQKFHNWQSLQDPREPTLVVFDLAGPGRPGRAYLFVAKTQRDYQVSTFPFTRLPATGGLTMGAWEQGGMIYVLVVDEPNSGLRLKNLVRDQNLAVAPPRLR